MIRFKKLGYVAVNVTDVERSAAFYRDIVGLDLVGEITDNIAFLSCTNDSQNVVLYQSDKPGLKRIGFELESPEQVELAFDVLSKMGFAPQEVSKQERTILKTGNSFRFRDPSGIQLEFYHGLLQRPHPFAPHPIKLIKLDHIVLRVPNLHESLKFYLDLLNFKVSDYRYKPNGDVYFAFMRCFPNPYHHSFGLQQGEGDKPTLFHIALKVTDIDDIGIGRNRLIKNNVPIVFGPGRHMASGSIFMYFLDPDDLTLEYTLGMEEFPEEGYRQPRMLDHTAKTSDLWEGVGDPRIGKVGHVELDESKEMIK